MQQFFAKRLKPVHFARHRFEPKNQARSELIFPSCTSKAGAEAFDTKGYAIMDTGASRSVIGSENLPSMMQMLDPATRDRVREKPNCIGFRFGNNQIEHSFKQIWIPIRSEKQQIWIIVEVVPKHTPFLLSIQTMRKLGAVLNLEENSCVLQKLGRSIPLRIGKTGLLMINMADLCQSPPMSAFVTSRLISPPESSSTDRHAYSKGSHGHDQGDSRSRDAVAPDFADPVDESGSSPGGRGSRAASPQRARSSAPDADARSSRTKSNAAGDLKESEDRWQFPNSPPGLRVVRSVRKIHIWEDEMHLLTEQSKTAPPISPTRQMQIPTIASLPKTPSRAAPAGTHGVRSPQTRHRRSRQ